MLVMLRPGDWVVARWFDPEGERHEDGAQAGRFQRCEGELEKIEEFRAMIRLNATTVLGVPLTAIVESNHTARTKERLGLPVGELLDVVGRQ